MTRIFEYTFSKGGGKNKSNYAFTVFEFRFAGSFPHCYLNRLGNRYTVRGVGVRVPLPEEFEKKFHLFAPQEYEIEALEIFTPDVLNFLLENDYRYDIELAEGELLVFHDKLVDSQEELEREWQKVFALMRFLARKLDQADFEPVGDYPHHLRKASIGSRKLIFILVILVIVTVIAIVLISAPSVFF